MEFHREPTDEQEPVYEEVESFVLRDPNEGPELFSARQSTFVDAAGQARVVTARTVYPGGCGHVIAIGPAGPAELAGRCELCGSWTCTKCLARCSRCYKAIGPECLKKQADSFYCRSCHWKVALLRVGHSLLRLLHKGMSKEM